MRLGIILAYVIYTPTDSTQVQPYTNGSSSKQLNGSTKSSLTVPPSPSTLAPGLATVPASPKHVNGFPKAGDGEWGRTGWEPRFGDLNEALRLVDATSDHQTFVAANLDDKFFGGKNICQRDLQVDTNTNRLVSQCRYHRLFLPIDLANY